MASIALKFGRPDIEDLTRLYIYEAASSVGPFHLIETVTDLGTYPDYIEHYTSDEASASDNWFTVQWEDSHGARTNMSAPVKGGTATLVGEIVERVLQRDRTLDLNVVQQEAEGAIQMFYGDGTDPYSTDLNPSYRVKNGLTYIVMARALIASSIKSSEVQSATMGLISMKSATATNMQKDVDTLLQLANKELGLSLSYVMLIEDIDESTYITADFSRLVSGYLSIDT